MFVDKKLFSSTLMPVKRKQAQSLVNNTSIDNDAVSTFEEIEKKENHNVIKTICSEFLVCFKSIKFVMLNLTLIFIYYGVSAIQFWINDYLEECLKIDNPKKRLILFASIVITSPILGIILGGVVIKSLFGGYDKPRFIRTYYLFIFCYCYREFCSYYIKHLDFRNFAMDILILWKHDAPWS